MYTEEGDLDLQRLRRETATDHSEVERILPLMDERLSTARYIACLRRMCGLVSGWEERAAETAPYWLQGMLAARRRTQMLKLDLAWFGIAEPVDERPSFPALSDLPSLLGSMYVMEGSTLGGQFIARHVEAALPLTRGRGDAYFCGHGDRTVPLWKEFCEVLAVRVPDRDAEAVVLSAKAMFALFGSWMQKESTTHGS